MELFGRPHLEEVLASPVRRPIAAPLLAITAARTIPLRIATAASSDLRMRRDLTAGAPRAGCGLIEFFHVRLHALDHAG